MRITSIGNTQYHQSNFKGFVRNPDVTDILSNIVWQCKAKADERVVDGELIDENIQEERQKTFDRVGKNNARLMKFMENFPTCSSLEVKKEGNKARFYLQHLGSDYKWHSADTYTFSKNKEDLEQNIENLTNFIDEFCKLDADEINQKFKDHVTDKSFHFIPEKFDDDKFEASRAFLSYIGLKFDKKQ